MKRRLGRSGIEISALGMGCWAIGGPLWDGETPHGWGEVDDEETRQITGSDPSPEGIRSACEDSLGRLGTDYIDLYQFHDHGYPPDKAEPVRETLEELMAAGKIRSYGWSTAP